MFSFSQVREVKAYRDAGLPVLVVEYGRLWEIQCLAHCWCFEQLVCLAGTHHGQS